MNDQLINETEEYVNRLLHEESAPENLYHNTNHTREVVDAVYKISEAENVSDEDKEVLVIAAWLHDTGYTDCCDGHENVSAENAKKFLETRNYPAEKIDKVIGCIMATKVPQNPQNFLEEIICDADLHHLGKKGFRKRNELFRAEREKKLGVSISDVVWTEKNIEFFKSHKFFTHYARSNYDERKVLNLIKLEKLLKTQKEIEITSKTKIDRLKLQKEKLKSQTEKSSKAERGIETMFRNTQRTHVSFSSMADTKANIMISVNTLILTAIVAILARKLDSNPHLIVPTLVLTVVSMTTLVFAVLVTRPKVNEGKFTKEDIKQKKANLLFFGNFYNMPLDDFVWGMKEVISDKSYLYDSMIKDFYFLGQVLGRKYRYLRICYSIFMYGLLVSIITFAAAIFLYPQGMNTQTDAGKVKVEQSDNSNNIFDILE